MGMAKTAETKNKKKPPKPKCPWCGYNKHPIKEVIFPHSGGRMFWVCERECGYKEPIR